MLQVEHNWFDTICLPLRIPGTNNEVSTFKIGIGDRVKQQHTSITAHIFMKEVPESLQTLPCLAAVDVSLDHQFTPEHVLGPDPACKLHHISA